VELADEEISSLFRSWLRALLYWEETEGFVTRTVAISFAPIPLCSAPDGQAFGLSARVGGVVDTGPRVREIKGVTLHGLFVEREGEVWRGRVIFDV
jgi:SHS2 domain-containing protein